MVAWGTIGKAEVCAVASLLALMTDRIDRIDSMILMVFD